MKASNPKGILGLLLGFLIGAVNGYLLFGTLWWVVNFYQYPFGLVAQPLPAGAQQIVSSGVLPLELLGGGAVDQSTWGLVAIYSNLAGNSEGHSMSDLIQLPPNARLHIVGIGGAGMSAIATVLLERGHPVSGSDQAESEVTHWLREQGAEVFIGHRAENVGEVDMVVMSSAIRADNPELIAAQERGIPVNKRAQFLGWLMQGSLGVAVAGTHGKTTTTAMIAHTLMGTGRDPSFIVGGHDQIDRAVGARRARSGIRHRSRRIRSDVPGPHADDRSDLERGARSSRLLSHVRRDAGRVP